jgi:hypothetical protein
MRQIGDQAGGDRVGNQREDDRYDESVCRSATADE